MHQKSRWKMLRSVALCIVLLLIIIPASGAIITFIPGSDSISSLDVKDIAESHDGMIAFATANGLSLFDSDWATIQAKHGNMIPDCRMIIFRPWNLIIIIISGLVLRPGCKYPMEQFFPGSAQMNFLTRWTSMISSAMRIPSGLRMETPV